MRSPSNRRIVALVYDGLSTFEFAILVEVFGLARPELPVNWYQFSACSLERSPVRATGGVLVTAKTGLSAFHNAGTIIIPGWRNADEQPPKQLLAALRRAHERGVRLMSICSGVFVLAAAGLLDGRKATTHWRYVDSVRARYPKIRLEPDILYTEDGNVLTSAGSAAGIDLCLHVVRKDYGADIANSVARRLVVPPHRDGGQAQFVHAPIRNDPTSGLAPLMQWAAAHLGARLTVDDLASRAKMSMRTFARRFVEETGTTPHRWLTQQRLIAAQRRLETSNDSVDLVAERVGLDTAQTLRHHFRRAFGTTPTAYRRRFTTRRGL